MKVIAGMVFIKVLTNNIEEERKTVTNVGIAVRVLGQYPIWCQTHVSMLLKRVVIGRDKMEKNKSRLEQIVVGLVSILFVAGLFYYILFHSFLHDRVIQLWKMMQLIVN